MKMLIDTYEMYPVYSLAHVRDPRDEKHAVEISDELRERYRVAEMAWDAVQHELHMLDDAATSS